MFDSLLKAAVAVVRVPVSVAADAITLGGSLTDKERPYAAGALSDLVKNLEDAAKPDRPR